MDPRLQRAREILRVEGTALERAADTLDQHFTQVVDAVLECRGKIVLTGVGKSGLIAQKIAATLSSTGTPALYLHSVEAVHGDLGLLSATDLLVAISNSGEVSEVVNMVVAAQRIGTPAVAMTRNPESSLARECRYLLPIVVDGEAGPLGLAPTTSTTVTLALGDALAMVLMDAKNFTAEQFRMFHPGGNLGRRLALRVADLARTDELPIVPANATVREALAESTARGYGVALIVDDTGALCGVVTDGDVRRMLQQPGDLAALLEQPVHQHMTESPLTIEADVQAAEALQVMESKGVIVLPTLNPHGAPVGLLHIHDILGRGKFIL
ncbi:MAG: KpsF/GutQ family sugar-phosphate isomerase [Planctomycetota bacterium]